MDRTTRGPQRRGSLSHGSLFSVHDETPPRSHASPVMTTAEVAQFLRVHRSTIYKLLRQRRIPVFKIASEYRFDKDAVEKWMADKQVKTNSELD